MLRVFSEWICLRYAPSPKRYFDQYCATSDKRCEIGCKLVLFTNRKSHEGFRLVPKSVLAYKPYHLTNSLIMTIIALRLEWPGCHSHGLRRHPGIKRIPRSCPFRRKAAGRSLSSPPLAGREATDLGRRRSVPCGWFIVGCHSSPINHGRG